MIRQLCTAAAAALALASAAGAAEDAEAQQVTVMGRIWTVVPVADKAGAYAATREAPLAFAPPPKLKVVQAMRAIRAATGCTPNYDGMYSTISGTYVARVICPK